MTLESFASPGGDMAWYVVNDNVMGGRSRGGFEIADGALHFAGTTNTNGGGFSSLRTGPLALDLAHEDGISLTLIGDGRRYTWRLTTDARWRGREVAYWAGFDTAAGQRQRVQLPFGDFVPRFRGTQLSGPPLDPARITGMGIMIYDGADGPFALTLENVDTFGGTWPLDMQPGRHRWLVVAAATAAEPAVVQQLASVSATGSDFAERDLRVVVVTDDGAAPPGHRVPDADQRAQLRARFGLTPGEFAVLLVGKDGTVKRRADQPVAMREIYAQIDTMPMRRREMRERALD